MRIFEIAWQNVEAKGYPDVLPLSLFAAEVSGSPEYHVVRGPKGGASLAQFALTVTATSAELDYRPYKKFNDARDIVGGVLRLEFADASRRQVKRLLWDGEVLQQPEDIVVSIKELPSSATVEAIVQNQKKVALQIARPGQAAFRKKLAAAYGGRCAISGCAVSWTLQAAHIRPFGKPQGTYQVSNGLLLRADLHLLFDAELLAIDPATRTIYFAHEVRHWPEYKGLHGASLRKPDSAKAAPDSEALEARWERFQERVTT